MTDLRVALRQRLTVALKGRDRVGAVALRSIIAALDNAEAVEIAGPGRPTQVAAAVTSDAYVAGAVAGLGAAEAERRELDPDEQRTLVSSQLEAWESAAVGYEQRGHAERAQQLRQQIEVIRAALRG